MSSDAGAPPAGGLREAAITGIRWVAAVRIGAEASAFLVAVALARLITPAAFGRAAVVLVLAQIATIITFEGFGSALVQRREVSAVHIGSAAVMSLTFGAALFLAVLLAGVPLARRLFGPETARLVRLLSPVFLAGGLGAVPRAMLQRKLAFRRLSFIEITALISGAAASLALALAGQGATALILGALTTSLVSSMLLFACAPVRRLAVDMPAVREIGAFGLPASLAAVTYVLRGNADYAILASQLPAGQVGIYWRAFQLGAEYQDKISGVMLRLVFPLYARSGDLDTMRIMRERVTRLHAAIIFPLLGLLIVTAPIVVPLMFGPRWSGAVVPTQILAGVGMCAAVLTGYPQLLCAAGRPRLLLRFEIASLAAFVAVVAVVAPYGIVAVSVADLFVYIAMVVMVQLVLVRPVLGVPFRSLRAELGPALTATAGLVAAALALAVLMRHIAAPPLVSLAATGAVGAVAYLAIIRLRFPAAWGDLTWVAAALTRRRGFPGRARADPGAVASGASVRGDAPPAGSSAPPGPRPLKDP